MNNNYFLLTIDTTQIKNDPQLRTVIQPFGGVEFQAGSWLLTADSMEAIYSAVVPHTGADNVTIFPVQASDLQRAKYVNGDLRGFFDQQQWAKAS